MPNPRCANIHKSILHTNRRWLLSFCGDCLNLLDFGPGFYMTDIETQAQSWAIVVAGRKGRTITPVVSKYSFDRESALNEDVIFKVFPEYDLDWLDFVVSCRKGKDYSSVYDVVEGGIANDNVIDTVEDYEKGIITAEQALGQLRYKHVNHQLCVLNQFVIDKYLRFEGSEEVKV